MLRAEPRLRRWLRLAGDLALCVAAFYLAFLLRMRVPLPLTEQLLPPDRLEFFTTYWPLVALSQPLVLYFFGLYDPPQPRDPLETVRRLVPAVTLLALGLGAFFFFAERTFPPSVLMVFTAVDFLLLAGWRTLLGGGGHGKVLRLAVVGCGRDACELAATLHRHPLPEVELAGWVLRPGDEPPEEEELPDDPRAALGPCLGTVEDLPALIRAGAVNDVVIAAGEPLWKSRLLDTLAAAGAGSRGNVLLVPGPFDSMIGRMRYRWVRDIPLIEVVRDSEWRLFRPVKRAFDLAAGGVLLVLSVPALLLGALLVRSTSPGPVFYRQERVGRGLKPFVLWKLRTMRIDAEPENREMLASLDDPRLTPVGAMLRRYRVDELPQLFNVLGGSMSLVGPRPERPGFVRRYLDDVPGYAERFSVAPGLTGLAQIRGDYHSTPTNKLRYDLAYIANWSFLLDLALLVRTVKIVLTSRGV